MLTRTTAMRIDTDATIDSIAQAGSKYALISNDSGDACDACTEWAGKLIQVVGKTQGIPTLEDAKNAGVFHPNCTHRLEYIDDSELPAYGITPPGKTDKPQDVATQDKERTTTKPKLTPQQREAKLMSKNGIKPFTEDKRFRALTPKQQKEFLRQIALTQTNPWYETGEYQWTNNCQRCVPCSEAIRRGWNVTAKPRPLNKDDPNGLHIYANLFSVYKNPKPIIWKTKKDIETQMKKWGDGARGQIHIWWDRGGGHVFNCEQRDGKTVFYDCQDGEQDSEYLFDHVANEKDPRFKDPGPPIFVRIDNLKFSDRIKECIRPI